MDLKRRKIYLKEFYTNCLQQFQKFTKESSKSEILPKMGGNTRKSLINDCVLCNGQVVLSKEHGAAVCVCVDDDDDDDDDDDHRFGQRQEEMTVSTNIEAEKLTEIRRDPIQWVV
jgi:hypothetical protein